ncbi:hypothetical protein [Ancylobacter sp. TS-1]|uniref:hypothetical protein n=1 Tax=Ancylobacter sp. TS-1 TaxID=1850374 RepID=UPI001265B399|nr:hypothetical protein [Ancylobacter sp. TS-1]QFR33178.1 hypothetical protein GBB76_08545 [Ancylobacter sp. TS-1]
MATDDPNKGAQDKTEAELTEAGAKASRRKPPTLDLSARDVTPLPDDAATAATASDDPPPAETAAPDSAPEVPGETTDAAAPPPVSGRPPRPLGLFGVAVAALVSGVIGGAVALAVVSTFYSAEDNIDAITELEARALDLRQRMETLESRGSPAPAPAAGLAAPDELAARLDALESGIDTLGKRVDTLPTSAPAPTDGAPAAPAAEVTADVAALAGRVEALEQKAASAPASAPAASPEDVAAVAARIAALEQRVAALPAPAPAASPAAVAEAQARIAALEGRLNAMADAQRASGQGASQLVALASLRDAVVSGRPFATELKAARVLLGEEAAPLAALEAASAAGFGDGPALAARLKAATAPVPAPAPATPAAGTSTVEGVVERLWDSAQNLVVIRRAAGPSGDPRLADADAALARGDYASARTALAGMPESERAAVQPVIAAIEARQAALAAIAGLNQRVLATLAGGAQ